MFLAKLHQRLNFCISVASFIGLAGAQTRPDQTAVHDGKQPTDDRPQHAQLTIEGLEKERETSTSENWGTLKFSARIWGPNIPNSLNFVYIINYKQSSKICKSVECIELAVLYGGATFVPPTFFPLIFVQQDICAITTLVPPLTNKRHLCHHGQTDRCTDRQLIW